MEDFERQIIGHHTWRTRRRCVRAIAAGGMALALSGAPTFAQSTWTNIIPGNETDVWGVAVNWIDQGGTNGIPGFDANTSTGNSNDDAVVYFGTTADGAPALNLQGSNYVLRSLYISESTNAGIDANANFISWVSASDQPAASLTLEEINYFQGGRELDFYTNVAIIDKVDGQAFNLTNVLYTLDFGGGFRGTEGINMGGSSTIYFRGYDMAYGTDATNGLTLLNFRGGSRRMAFNQTFTSNMVHDIPNLTFDDASSGAGSLTFLNMSPSNTAVVNISNVSVGAQQYQVRIGGESAADGTPIVTVNINDDLDFATGTVTNIDRYVYNASVHGGIVNLNGDIIVNQDWETSRYLIFSGDGVFNLNGNVLQTNGTARTRPTRLDGDRSLVVAISNDQALGDGLVQLYAGSVLRMNYDVYASLTNGGSGYAGSNLVYSQGNDVNLDFGVAQSGFYDPRDNTGVSGLVVRAFNGIAGNLTGATYTNADGHFANNTISFQTNAVIAENAINPPTFAQVGNTLWMGITNAAGAYTDLGNTGTIYRGAAIGALTPMGEGDILSANTSIEATPAQSGYRGDMTAASGQDLRVLVAGYAFVTPLSGTDTAHRATFNADTGNAIFEGPGTLNLLAYNGWQTFDGTASNLFRLGLDGVVSDENPQGINSQNTEILRFTYANALRTNTTMTVANGQVRFYSSADALGNANNLSTTLIVSNGASIYADNASSTSHAAMQINRGKIIFEGDGGIYTSGGGDWFTLSTLVRTSMVFSPQSLLIINDFNDTRFRDLSGSAYPFFFTNMNIVIGDDIMRTARVSSASGFAIGDGKRLIGNATTGANLDRIFYVSAGATNDTAVTAVRNASEVRIVAPGGETFNIRADVATTNAALTILNNYTNRFITVLDNSSTRSNATQNGTLNLSGLDNRFQDLRLEGGTASIYGTNLIANDVESTGMGGATGALRLYSDRGTIGSALATGGGDFTFGDTSNDVVRVLGDVVMRDYTNDSANISFAAGIVEVGGNILLDHVSNTNRALPRRIDPVLTLYADTNIIHGSVYIGPTNGMAGSARLAMNNTTNDVTVIGGDLVLNTVMARTTGSSVSGGDLVVSNNIIINPTGLDYRDATLTNETVRQGVSSGSTLFQVIAYRDFVTNDGVGILDRLVDGTMALGPDGIIVKPRGNLLLEFNRTNTTQTVGQKITIDNNGPYYGAADQAVLWMRANTNAEVGGPGTGTVVLDITNVWLNEGAHVRLNEEGGIAARLGLVLAGTNTYLGESTSGTSSSSNEDFDLLDIVSSVPGQARTLQLGNTNGVSEASFESGLFGTASSDVTLDVRYGTLTVTNGVGNFLGTARAGGYAAGTNGVVRLVSTALDGLSSISGRVEVGDFGQLYLAQPRMDAITFIGNEIRVANTGAGNYYFGTQSVIQVATAGGASGTTIFALTNVVMAPDASLRVDSGANTLAAVSLKLEGNATVGNGIGTTSDDFGLIDVTSSSPGSARTLQVGATGGDEEPLNTLLVGVASPDITFDIVNGGMVVTNAGGDVQGSVRVHAGSIFASQNPIEELLNLAGNGAVVGNLLVSNTLAPGLGMGTLTATGGVAFVPTSILNFELSATSTNVGGGFNDLLQVASPGGNLTLDGTLFWTNVASVVGNGWTNGDYWTLFTYEGTLSDHTLDLGMLPALDSGLMWTLDTSTFGEVRLSIAIPEPSTWALVIIGFGLIACLPRRRVQHTAAMVEQVQGRRWPPGF